MNLEECVNVSAVVPRKGSHRDSRIEERDRSRTLDLKAKEGKIKLAQTGAAREIRRETGNDTLQPVCDNRQKSMYKKLNKNIILVRNINNVQKSTFLNENNVQMVNSGEHAYCQLKEESEEHFDANNVVESYNIMRNDAGLVTRNHKDNMGVHEYIIPEKMDQIGVDNNLRNVTECVMSEIKKDVPSDELEVNNCNAKEFKSYVNSALKNNNVVSWASSPNNLFARRRLHKSYITIWSTQIGQFGAAKCLIETCNFISLDLPTIQEHYRLCDGVSQNDINVCPMCKCWLNSQSDLMIHKLFCKGGNKSVGLSSNESNTEGTGIQSTEVQMNDITEDSEVLVSLSVAEGTNSAKATKHCEQCDQHFLSHEDYSHHISSCTKGLSQSTIVVKKKWDPNMCVSKIARARIDKEFDESCIVQPGRVIPKGQYVRRRAYTKQHKTAWDAAIKKFKHVKCIFQNCHFLAMSVEDMISHFGYCNGDGSFAKFTCPYCEGRVTSERILKIHIRRSHTFEHYDNSQLFELDIQNDDGNGSPLLHRKELSSGTIIEYADDSGTRLSEGVEESVEGEKEVLECDYEDKTVSRDLYYYEEENSYPEDANGNSPNELPNSQSEGRRQTLDCETRPDCSNEVENTIICSSHDMNSDNSPEKRVNEIDSITQNCFHKVQNSQKNVSERDYKDDHIYFKRKGKTMGGEADSAAFLLVMKNSNLRHYSGPRNVSEKLQSQKDHEIVNEEGECAMEEKDENMVTEKGHLPSNKASDSVSDSGSDNGGKYVRQMIKFSFPSIQNTRRKVQQCYTNSWRESIKTNGFARCLVATCNFISLDIFHVQNHFKTCSGVPANGPNLCNFCNSWLPSAVELSAHASKCKANVSLSEVARTRDDAASVSVPSEGGRNVTDGSGPDAKVCLDVRETAVEAEPDRVADSDLVICSNNSGAKNESGNELCLNKEKAPSLRISDIMKLKDSGVMDYNRIIQPGPELPKGQYLRRRAYTKQHKSIWEAALEMHKYVKCIFQNCHFLAMSLEDMIYHFGYCIGDGSFAKFECPHCKGRLTSELVLGIHIRASHPEMVTDETPSLPTPNNGGNDSNDELLTSVDELKKILGVKEIKTYARQSLRSKAKQSKMTDTAIKNERVGCAAGGSSGCEDSKTDLCPNNGGFTSSEDTKVEEGVNQVDANIPVSNHSSTDMVKEEYELRNNSVIGVSVIDKNAVTEKDDSVDSRVKRGHFVSSAESQKSSGIGDVANSKNNEDINILHAVNIEGEKKKVEEMLVQPKSVEQLKSVSQSEHGIGSGGSGKSKPGSSSHSSRDPGCKTGGTDVDNNFSLIIEAVKDVDVNVLPSELENSEKEPMDGSSNRSSGKQSSSTKDGTVKNGDGGETSSKSSSSANGKGNRKEGNGTGEGCDNEEKPVRRRGRKPKSQSLKETAASDSASKQEKVKKEAGDTGDALERQPKRRLSDRQITSESVAKRLGDSEVAENDKAEGSNSKRMKVEVSESEDRGKAAGNPAPRRSGRPPKKLPLSDETPKSGVVSLEKPEQTKKGRRGRKRKSEIQAEDDAEASGGTEDVKCALCDFKTKRRSFSDHNFKKHVGLGWIEGDNPIDIDNEELISWNIKQAFRVVKSATCRNCNSVKKSALGFISHIQNCGKSEEEKEALKVTCPHCPSRILKYSLPMHLKLSHSDSPAEGNKTRSSSTEEGSSEQLPAKRKSAIRAVNKFQEVLKQCDDEDDSKRGRYVFYEKGVSKMPTLPYKIRGLWNKMKKEKRKIPCRRGSCLVESSTIQDARRHHFMCPELPHQSYVCLLCDYYSTEEDSVKEHVKNHPKTSATDGDFTIASDEENVDEEAEMDYEEEPDGVGQSVHHRLKAADSSVDENGLEAAYRAKFFAREKLLNERKVRFCRRSLYMTLESELGELRENHLSWLDMQTKSSDWVGVAPDGAASYLPSLEESMSICVVPDTRKTIGPTWRRFKRFEADIVEGSPLIFTGGSIRSMSWCKVSCIRASNLTTRQYLAVSSSRRMEKFQDIHKVCDDSSGLIQIWDCGDMNYSRKSAGEVPKMAVGIVHNSGEVWDLSWLPLDTFKEGADEALTRIGVLCAACQDGTVRVWSICDPEQLKSGHSLPLFRIEPSVILELEENKGDDGCLRLACGRTGIIVGGFASGMIAVWSLKSVTSPFCKRVGKSALLKPYLSFQAHRTSITALSICQNSDRYITTSGLDRFIKFWDLECTVNPFESLQKEVCLDNVWPRHWPLTISTFEDIIPGSGKGMIKAIRGAYCDKHRAPLAMESTCWSLSFNEWMNILSGCSHNGEVIIRYLRNMFLADEKFRRNGNILSATELRLNREVGRDSEEVPKETVDCGPGNSKGSTKKTVKEPKENLAIPRTYEEAYRYFGLIFNEYQVDGESSKNSPTKCSTKDDQSVEGYPIISVNKVCWNPNYNAFSHVAIGHQSGFVRIKALNDYKCDEELSKFFRKAKDVITKLSPDGKD